ncbi:hypothetical protein [Streptomyces sp. CA-111067]|uniref:hypothetical protein n=1 Tax=Streptomyces sp. CA-111067 TaxID=3240046 RepID=UPI003D96E8C3
MTTYVVTVPGTFAQAPSEQDTAELKRALRAADPRGTDFGEAEDLDALTLYSGTSAFSLRLEIEADDSPSAEGAARTMATAALRSTGFDEHAVSLGDPVITGIDSE